MTARLLASVVALAAGGASVAIAVLLAVHQ
jgi:hypothetical protein